MTKFFNYIADEANFLIVFAYLFACIFIMWFFADTAFAYLTHIPAFWNITINGKYLPVFNRVMLLTSPAIFLALMFTPLFLMSRYSRKIWAKVSEFKNQSNSNDRKVLESLKTDMSIFCKNRPIQSSHYTEINTILRVINAKLSILP